MVKSFAKRRHRPVFYFLFNVKEPFGQTFSCFVWVHNGMLLVFFQENFWRYFLWSKHRIISIIFSHLENYSEVFSLCLTILEAALEGLHWPLALRKKLSLTVRVGVAVEGSLPVKWLWKAFCSWNIRSYAHFVINCSHLSVYQTTAEGYMCLLGTKWS